MSVPDAPSGVWGEFPLIKLAKKLKEEISFLQMRSQKWFPLIKLAKKLKEVTGLPLKNTMSFH